MSETKPTVSVMPEQQQNFGDVSLQMIRTMEKLSVHTEHILERLKKINGSVGEHEKELSKSAQDLIAMEGEVKAIKETVANIGREITEIKQEMVGVKVAIQALDKKASQGAGGLKVFLWVVGALGFIINIVIAIMMLFKG